jgi:signal transduction histidine kinase
VFGKLSPKQKEYLGIIHNSGENIHYLVKEILNLGSIDEQAKMLELIPVNIEMLAQKAINSLSEVAKQKRQDIRLSIELGKRVWLLDKDKFRQAIYYVISSVIEASEPGGEIRIHISRRSQTINFAIWMYHPWVGDGLPHIHLQPPLLIPGGSKPVAGDDLKESLNITSKEQLLTVPLLESLIQNANDDTQPILKQPQKLLGLLLGCYLIEFHGGKIIVQGSSDAGYRYVMMLPKIAANEDDSSKIWV